MKNTLLSLLGILFLSTSFLMAQDRNCSSMDVLDRLESENPQMKSQMNQIEEFTQRFINSPQSQARAVITIPVVVHVVYNRRSTVENISDAQIQSQIDVLNDDFRRLNSDKDNVWSQAADTEIEFCLATVDPSGNPTNGITRTSSRKRSFGTTDAVKSASSGGKDPWPASDYLNIWVCNIGGGILGYAQFPGGPASTDGVVNDYRYFGTIGTASAPFDLGRTCTHEVGHYLNLRHIWGDGPCSVDDFVGDTPLSDGPNYGCALGTISCSSTDMVQNYMDYSDDACMNLFTAGQKARMQATLAGVRNSLTQSDGCGNGGPGPVNEICDNGIDDDNDGLVDCDDPDCTSDSNCQVAGTCDPATGLSASPSKNGRRASLSWNAATGAQSYTIELNDGSGFTNVGTVSGTSANVSGLSRGNSYSFRVVSNCAGGQTATSATASFSTRTSGARLGNEEFLLAYPNPAKNQLTLEFGDLGTDWVNVEILDLMGQRVRTIQKESATEGFIELNIGDIASGVYIVRMTDEYNEVYTTKISVVK